MEVYPIKHLKTKTVLMIEFSEHRYDARVAREVTALRDFGFDVTLIMFSQFVERKTSTCANGLKIKLYPFKNRRSDKGFFKNYFRLGTAFVIIMKMWLDIFKSKSDCFHAHNLYFLIPVFIKAKLSSAKFVYDAHELHSQHHSNRTVKGRLLNKCNYFYERFFVRRAHAVIQASEERADYVRDLYRIEKPSVINNYVPIQNISSEKILPKMASLPKSAKIILYTGGVYAGTRRLDKIVEAIAQIEYPETYFVILGFMKHSVRETIQSIARAYSVEKRVVILPPVHSSKVAAIASSANVGVIPLSGDRLSIKLSALNKISEYLMVGLPIACTDYPNLNKIVYANSVGQVGETFEVDDSLSIKNALKRILDREAELSANARRLALKEYNWDSEKAKLKALYMKMLMREEMRG